ncbi:helix-turn-helix transcriptional regulator [Actinoalloteichus hymeniacidonis]|uniref:Transcriptional regulator, luxR family n=1 Tax=Actinoalloteichus hymeniacidonis TaxID=340345 RepID=A0AAC9HRD2_9PSEU|nr:LuxR C-terminal-related transcriptional regulator [Actinoalloteichus hymeniacidonis]AOS64023.1 transcriptional regulator, luxR family [Actinoalloteichus hymeniacidonis]MBB5907915.1 DNA-binding CsgD family transcriptional regulator [Actinoalloteichus hymeniacidonis]
MADDGTSEHRSDKLPTEATGPIAESGPDHPAKAGLASLVEGEGGWPLIGLATATLLGAVIGVIAIPSSLLAIVVMAVVQLGVTALGLIAVRRPVLWAVAIGIVSIGSAAAEPGLAELAYSGATPWIACATAAGTLNLFWHASDRRVLAAGAAALLVGSTGLIAVTIRFGVPPAQAILTSSVPFLIGALFAAVLHLRDARQDRVRRPELLLGEADRPDSGAGAGSGDAALRALAIVALRSDELASTSADATARRAAIDLREVARRALTGDAATADSVARIELLPARQSNAPQQAAGPMPELPDREREILRLVATGASNAAIGRSLYLSEATVKQYVSRLMRRFDRDNRTRLALLAARWFDEP